MASSAVYSFAGSRRSASSYSSAPIARLLYLPLDELCTEDQHEQLKARVPTPQVSQTERERPAQLQRRGGFAARNIQLDDVHRCRERLTLTRAQCQSHGALIGGARCDEIAGAGQQGALRQGAMRQQPRRPSPPSSILQRPNSGAI
jgi:hypothetical protein